MKGESIYMQVMVQMYLKGWDNKTLAEKSGMNYTTLRQKMRGIRDLTLTEAKRIQSALNCGMTLDDLFEERKRQE